MTKLERYARTETARNATEAVRKAKSTMLPHARKKFVVESVKLVKVVKTYKIVFKERQRKK